VPFKCTIHALVFEVEMKLSANTCMYETRIVRDTSVYETRNENDKRESHTTASMLSRLRIDLSSKSCKLNF